VGITNIKKKGCLYWLIIGWWLRPILWLYFFIPMLFLKLFGRNKVQTNIQSTAVCQSCGNSWKV